jgi:hypothetical protein
MAIDDMLTPIAIALPLLRKVLCRSEKKSTSSPATAASPILLVFGPGAATIRGRKTVTIRVVIARPG